MVFNATFNNISAKSWWFVIFLSISKTNREHNKMMVIIIEYFEYLNRFQCWSR